MVKHTVKIRQRSTPKLWGLFGGSFDPVHIGHIQTASAVKQQLQLENVVCLPAARSPFKGMTQAEDEHRAQMLRLVLEDQEGFELDEREFSRPPPSYTVDTIANLVDQFSNVKWVLILGADAWNGFNQWRDPKRILSLVHIAVMTRPGYSHQSDHGLGSVVDTPAGLSHHTAGKVIYIEVPEIDVSSTMLRQRLADGQSADGFLEPKVMAYIKANNLYQ